MRSIMLAVSFLKKQWVMNVVLVVEILISVIMLSELFLFVSDRMDNQRAAEELQNNHLYVLSEFEYYAPQEERVMEALRADEAIQSIGKVDISSCTWNGQYFQLGLYNANLIGLYAPKCASGAWLPTEGGEYSGYPAVVSADAGLQVGDAAEILVADQYSVAIEVVGVLALRRSICSQRACPTMWIPLFRIHPPSWSIKRFSRSFRRIRIRRMYRSHSS